MFWVLGGSGEVGGGTSEVGGGTTEVPPPDTKINFVRRQLLPQQASLQMPFLGRRR